MKIHLALTLLITFALLQDASAGKRKNNQDPKSQNKSTRVDTEEKAQQESSAETPTLKTAQFNDLDIEEIWSISTQGKWNKVLSVNVPEQMTADFASVIFNVSPSTSEVANLFVSELNEKVKWPLGMMSPSQIGFKVVKPTSKMKALLVEQVKSFNSKFIEKLKKEAIVKAKPGFAKRMAEGIIYRDPVVMVGTHDPSDVAFVIELKTIQNPKYFAEIQQLFNTDLLVHQAIGIGLEKIYSKSIAEIELQAESSDEE